MGTKARGRTALLQAVAHLNEKGIRMFYRNLTTIDALQAGAYVVRVLSPDMIPINSHHAWPFIGGNAHNIAMRYPGTPLTGLFPNAWPHPLG